MKYINEIEIFKSKNGFIYCPGFKFSIGGDCVIEILRIINNIIYIREYYRYSKDKTDYTDTWDTAEYFSTMKVSPI